MRELSYLVLFPAVARSSSANGSGVDTQGLVEAGNGREMACFLDIGASSGTPTLDLKIQESDTSGGTYTDIVGAAFPQKTGVGVDTIFFRATKQWIRAVATIGGGTPNLTFSAHVVGTKRIK